MATLLDQNLGKFGQPGIRTPIEKLPFGVWSQKMGSQDLFGVMPQREDIYMRISGLEEKLRKFEKAAVGFIKINLLPSKNLKIPLDAIVEPDGEGFIARTVDLPLYGYGDDRIEAIEMLKYEIESLYDELMEDDNFSDEYLRIKRFLSERMAI
jgi:uncharacterized protein YqgQ